MPALGRLLTIPRRGLRTRDALRTESRNASDLVRQHKDLLDSIVRGSKNETAPSRCGLRYPRARQQDPSASASGRDRIDHRDEKVPPPFGVPANHVKRRLQARFLKSANDQVLSRWVSIACFAQTCRVLRRLGWLAHPQATPFPSG